jgi:threonine dehydrogenase-like Zn-dependent dehydrogenase
MDSDTMKALCLQSGALGLRDIAPPQPLADQALIRVSMAGICNTDLEIAKGYMGFEGVLGHELCGVVESCSDARWIGRRVAGEINLACTHCALCRRGLGRHCAARTVMGIVAKDGCFAEYVTLPLRNLHVLPDSLPDELACFVEPVAAAFELLDQVTPMPSDRVAVLGDGKLGLLAAQVMATSGCEVVLIGKHERKLARAHALGITTLGQSDLSPKSFDIVVEATGSPAGLEQAVALTRPRGTLMLKSTYHGRVSFDAAPLVIDEISVIGSRCGPFAVAVEALASRTIDVTGLVDAVLPLSSAVAALQRAAEPGVLKVLLDMRR